MKTLPPLNTTFFFCTKCGMTKHNDLTECPTLQRIVADMRTDAKPQPARSVLWLCIAAIGLAMVVFNWMVAR